MSGIEVKRPILISAFMLHRASLLGRLSIGRLTSIARNGGNTNYTYTDSGALAKIEHIGNNQVQNYFEYFYDQRNFPTTKRTPAGDFNYSYDNNGQLTGASHPSQASEAFSYDALGNRTADEARAYGYDSKGQRLLDDGVYLYQYDGNGNVTSQLPKNINSTADAYRFTYSSKNQLIKTEVFAGSLGAKIREVNYVYDILGRRMQKTVQDFVETSSILKNFTRKYGYDGQNIFVEFDQDNNLLSRHTHNPLTLDDILSTEYTVHAVNAQVAQYSGNFYYLKDHLGSIMDITDSSGNVVQKYEYKSFGKLISIKSGNGDDISAAPVLRNAFTYTGREWESETDMFYYRARWYSPATGRFLQSDPDPGKVGDPLSFNSKYIYAQNNPILYADPTGRGILEVFGAIATVFVSIVSGLWVGQLFAGLGTFWGGILGGLAGSVVGSQLGGVIMGLAYQGEGRSYSDGQRIGMQIGGFFGGFFGSMAGSGNMNTNDFWNGFKGKTVQQSAQCIAMSIPVRAVLMGTRSFLIQNTYKSKRANDGTLTPGQQQQMEAPVEYNDPMNSMPKEFHTPEANGSQMCS